MNSIRDNRNHLLLSLRLGTCRASEVSLSDPSLFCNDFGDSTPRRDSYSNLLKDMRNQARDARGVRPQANQVAVLFIDQETMDLDTFGIVREARDLHYDGMDVFVVDLGVRTNNQFLTRIASDPDKVFSTIGSLSIRELENRLLNKACESLNARSSGIFPPLPTPS